MTPADLVAIALLASLLLYVLLGGADFGAGFWDWVASGPRKREQRLLIEKAIAPVWEANHVWLILALVLLFTAFPAAFAAMAIAFYVPLSLLLVGIVLRGAAFIFRHYGKFSTEGKRTWGALFDWTSGFAPLCLGSLIGAITVEKLTWVSPVPIGAGIFTLAIFALIAAVYLTNETRDPELRNDFRKRALGAQVFVVVLGLGVAYGISLEPCHFQRQFSAKAQILTILMMAATFAALYLRKFRWARVFVISQVFALLLGWGLGMYPYLLPPHLTIHHEAAPPQTLKLLLAALTAGSVILFPSLFWLMKIFKQ